MYAYAVVVVARNDEIRDAVCVEIACRHCFEHSPAFHFVLKPKTSVSVAAEHRERIRGAGLWTIAITADHRKVFVSIRVQVRHCNGPWAGNLDFLCLRKWIRSVATENRYGSLEPVRHGKVGNAITVEICRLDVPGNIPDFEGDGVREGTRSITQQQ